MVEPPNSEGASAQKEGNSDRDISAVARPPAATTQELPPPISQSAKPTEQRRWTSDPPMFWVTFAGVIAVVAYTTVAAWQTYLIKNQLAEAQTANSIANEMFMASERQFVYLKEPISFENVPFNDRKQFIFYAIWVNGGNRPAKVEITTGGGEDTNVVLRTPYNHSTLVIGPHAEYKIMHVIQYPSQIKQYYIDVGKQFHVFGTAKYSDTVAGATRETRFCMVSTGLSMTYEGTAKTPALHGIAEPCMETGTNCTDKECNKYPPTVGAP